MLEGDGPSELSKNFEMKNPKIRYKGTSREPFLPDFLSLRISKLFKENYVNVRIFQLLIFLVLFSHRYILLCISSL